MPSNPLSIRDLGPELGPAFDDYAARKGLSRSEAARKLIADGLGIKPKRRRIVTLQEIGANPSPESDDAVLETPAEIADWRPGDLD